MRIKSVITVIILAAIIMGCGVTRPPINTSGISFDYEGKTYRIESMTPQFKEGYNVLVLKEGNKTFLRAIDKEQDGLLDKVVQGKLTLAQADEIYRYGIAEAKHRGNYRKRDFARVYRTSDVMNDYVLRTYVLAVGETYNLFSVQNKNTQEFKSVVLDLAADGSLNEAEKGAENMEYYQKLYQEILDQGLKEGKILKTDEMYLVALR